MGPSSNTSGSIAAMRAVWPADRPMGVRHSVTDWAEGGWTLADAEVFAGELKNLVATTSPQRQAAFRSIRSERDINV